MSYDTPQTYRYRDPGAPPHIPSLAVTFMHESVINEAITRETGVQSYDDVLVAYVGPMGQPKSTASCEIERTTPDGKVIVNREHTFKYGEQIKLYKAGDTAEAQGTPLKDLVGMTPALAQNLRARGVHTVEMLAEMSDSTQDAFMGFWDYRDRARAHLKARQEAAPTVRLEAELAEQRKTNQSLQRQLDDLKAMIGPEADKPRRGRPPKVQEAQAA
ncbi:hypothetical protein UFOVP833_60 [uncultured Caudovirales phage]|uniref:Uncharacterized protein n=1 Tax=uncultured Caudovirales phage TaxID=2100421 RepID=A0A6J5SS53_9CAUD|nr:hypothetical protein UFOVP833_60 [uncultured Caudovirales phage]CAB4218362.1 hypothetical protein UFOVP1603_28 [uncultured Caudovirales phage]